MIRLDSDDWFLPGAIKKMIATISKNRRAAAVFAGFVVTDERGVTVAHEEENEEHHPGCCLLLKWTVNEIGYKEGLDRFEGREFLKRFSEKHEHVHIKDACWAYRRHEDSKSAGEWEAKFGMDASSHPPVMSDTATALAFNHKEARHLAD